MLFVGGVGFAINFPTTPGSFGGNRSPDGANAFLAELSPDGTDLLWSGLFPGTNELLAISEEHLVAVGRGGSGFPTTPGSAQPTWCADGEGWAAKVQADGSRILWGTYMGGFGADTALDAAISGNGDVLVTGFSRSPNFPTTPNCFQPKFGGGFNDAFLLRLNPSGFTFLSSTFFGHLGTEGCTGVSLDASGMVLVSGGTLSSQLFVTPGAFDETGNDDAFLALFDPALEHVYYSTFLGGPGEDQAQSIAMSPDGLVTTVGHAFPGFQTTANAIYPEYLGGTQDAFITTMYLTLTGVRMRGTSQPSCLGPVILNATNMPVGGESFGVYITQAPPSTQGVLSIVPVAGGEVRIRRNARGALVPVSTGPTGFVEVPLGFLPRLPGETLRLRATFPNSSACPGSGPVATSNDLEIVIQ